MKRSPIRRKARRPDPAAVEAYAECHRRPGCEAQVPGVCTGRNEHAHHRRLRAQSGETTSANLLATCHRCHDWIHGHPAESHARGFILRTGDPIERWTA